MARQSKAERLAEVHDRAITGFDKTHSAQIEVRENCLRDRRFAYVTGAQWEGSLRDQFANRPMFEVNKVLGTLTRIFSEYRNNRISVDFRAKDDAASEDDADMLDGLYRADENDSNAQEAYDNAFDEGTAGGFGAWRLKAKYEDEDDEDDDRQRICIEPIHDADTSVYFDIDAKRQDKADATKCWLVYSMTPGDYEEKYNKSPASFQKGENLVEFDWFSPDVVYVAEYYEVESRKRKVHFYRLPATGEEIKVRGEELEGEEGDAYRQDLEDQGYVESRQKTITERAVHKYIIDGADVLEDCGIIAGKYIPIIPFYGKRMFIDNQERCFGETRPMVDPQRIYNVQVSALTEQSALFKQQKPIFTPEQVQGHEMLWANDNIDNKPYMMLNPVTDPATGATVMPGQVPYTAPPTVPPALQALIQVAQADMQELSGNQQQGDEIVSNISGEAVDAIQARLDMKTFLYTDNFAKAMRHCGVVWLSMASDLYVEEGRKMQAVGVDGTESMITLKEEVVDADGGSVVKNDLSRGKYRVVTDVGPAFTSKRDKTVKRLIGMLQFAQTDPTLTSAILGVALQNMDGEGLEDLRKWNRKRLVLSGVVTPTKEEETLVAQASQQQAQPTAQDQYLLASAAAQGAKADESTSNIIKNLATAEQAQATAFEKEANAAKTMAEVQSQGSQILALLQQLALQFGDPTANTDASTQIPAEQPTQQQENPPQPEETAQ